MIEKIGTTLASSIITGVAANIVNKWSGDKDISKILTDVWKKVTGIGVEVSKPKILMLGGRRAGKSTILASIQEELNAADKLIMSKTDIRCVFQDITNYEGGAKSLSSIRREIANDYCKRSFGKSFLVNTDATNTKSSYDISIRVNSSSEIVFEFVDVPGEWMRESSPHVSSLRDIVKDTDVFIVAVDTPYLMNDDESMNEVYNRTNEIAKLLRSAEPKDDYDNRLIILCPVKCEKWIHEGKREAVIQKTKEAYRQIINQFYGKNNVRVEIMPIETAGGLESAGLSDAKMYNSKPCFYIESTEQVRYYDGVVEDVDDEASFFNSLEDDFAFSRKNPQNDNQDLKYSWFQTIKEGNDLVGFRPKSCDQLFFWLLSFLVKKEVARLMAVKNGMIYINRKIAEHFTNTFGHTLPDFNEFVDKLHEKDIIKPV